MVASGTHLPLPEVARPLPDGELSWDGTTWKKGGRERRKRGKQKRNEGRVEEEEREGGKVFQCYL